MNKRITFILCSLLLGFYALRAERVMVVSDPHVIASSLLQPGAAADEMLASGRKMLDLSEPAFRALIDTALLYRPELVLIPGDLTKDGEQESHELVAQQLKRLTDAGIKVLVIPGNHDISNPASYAYQGDQKQKVANISDAEFDQIYAAYMPQEATARDSESHSYIAEPLKGVTILGIDGTHGNAGTGSLSDNTLKWVLAQADQAVAKGQLVIAMCHWQLIEHVDQQTLLLSASQMSNSAQVAEALATHKVHLVLTGHFHVNSISTAFYGTDLKDSLVEVSTGSPVAYPCPYRWLEISADRSTVTVATEDIRALDTITDLHAYSRAWQEEHTASMVPDMALRAWGKVDTYIAQMKTMGLSYKAMALAIEAVLPKTDSARIDLFERNMGGAVVALYMLHSDANEPDRPEKDDVKDSIYNGMTNMMVEVIGTLSDDLQGMMAEMAIGMAEKPVESICEDITTGENNSYTNRTDDLYPVLKLNAPQPVEAVEQVKAESCQTTYDVLGRPVKESVRGQVIIRNNQKQVTK